MPRAEKDIAIDRNLIKLLVGEIPLKSDISTEEKIRKIKASFLRVGALKQEAAINEIHPKDPKESVPVIIKIIKDLQERVKARKPRSKATEEFIAAALAKMEDVDHKQNLGLFDKKEALKTLTKDKIRAEMKPLIEKIDTITLSESELILWYELALWLEGGYQHVHQAALKFFNGKLKYEKDDPEIVSDYDWEDTALKAVTGVTKHFIQEFFHLFAEKLEQRIVASLSAKKQVSSETSSPAVPVSGFSYEIKPQEGGESEVRIRLQNYDTSQIEEAMQAFSRSLNHEPDPEKDFEEDSPKEVKRLPKVRQDKLLDLLRSGKDLPIELKFTLMVSGLNDCILTGREDGIVCDYVSIMVARLKKEYVNNSWIGPLPRKLFTPRTYANEVNEEIANMEKHKTALEIMGDLHKLWILALNDSSTNLKTTLISLGKDLYQLLETKLAAISEVSSSISAPLPSGPRLGSSANE